MELKLRRELQRLICQFHFLELPARRLFRNLFGPNKDPTGAGSSHISHSLKNFQLSPFINFIPISTNIGVIDIKMIAGRQDLLCLYELCQLLSMGKIEEAADLLEKYEKMIPQNIHSARWITLFSRIINLYMRTPKPSKKLDQSKMIVIS